MYSNYINLLDITATNKKNAGSSMSKLFNKLPIRDDLLKSDGKLTDNFNNKGKFLFFPNYVKLVDKSEGKVKKSMLMITGCNKIGEKVHIICKNIDIFFDVFPNPRKSNFNNKKVLDKLQRKISDLSISKKVNGKPKQIEYTKVESIEKFIFGIGYHRTKHKGFRLYFNTNSDRIEYIKHFKKIYSVYNDDLSHPENKISRDYNLSFNNWNYIESGQYEYVTNNDHFGSKAKHNITVDIDNIKLLPEKYARKLLVKDIVLTWDIETYTTTPGEINHEDDSNQLFMIGGTVHFGYERKALWKFCLVDKDTNPCEQKSEEIMREKGMDYERYKTDDDYDTIICGSEKNIVLVFTEIISKIQPDFIVGFNDSMFDWLSLFYKAKKYGLLDYMHKKMDITHIKYDRSEENIEKWYWREIPIKYDADTTFYKRQFKFNGCIPIDLSTEFRKLYPKSEVNTDKSLNFYLSANRLDSKDDMTYVELWDIYAEGDPEKLRRVAKYCVVDALRCNDLMVVRNRIAENREIAKTAFVKLYNSFYNAGGMKVLNLVIKYGIEHDYVFQTTRDKQDKINYPGAFVVEPNMGLNRTDPMTGIDFSSLYPSIMMTYNLSPEKIIYDQEHLNRFIDENGNCDLYLQEINFDNKEGDQHFHGWSVRHHNKGGDDKNDLENMGIFPSILKYLFDERVKIKKLMKPHVHYLEEIAKEENYLEIMETKEYKDHMFWFNYYNIKQLTLKVFMNTFYGVSGDCRNAIYEILVAGGTTSLGQYNIKMVYDFVVKHGYKVQYGDTDSLYIIAPEHNYIDIRKEYADGKITKLEYWTKLVEKKMEIIKDFNDEVNNCLKDDNGTKYLRMAYEEVLFPYILCGKKKYAGIPHEENINFNIVKDKQIFIRGLDCKKRGKTKLAVECSYHILRKLFDINNEQEVIDIVYDELDYIFSHNWGYHDFKRRATYKEKAKNVSVQIFIARMRKELEIAKRNNNEEDINLYKIPKNCDKFDFVVIEKPKTLNTRGNAIEPKVGDRMEFLDIAIKYKMPIDFIYYIEKQFVSIIASFCSYYPEFHEGVDKSLDFKEQYKKIVKNGAKYFINYCKKYSETTNEDELKYKSKKYQAVFRKTKKRFVEQNNNGIIDLFNGIENKLDNELYSEIIEHYQKIADKNYKKMSNIIELTEDNIDDYYEYYKNNIKYKKIYLRNQRQLLENWFVKNQSNIKELIGKYKNVLYNYIDNNRDTLVIVLDNLENSNLPKKYKDSVDDFGSELLNINLSDKENKLVQEIKNHGNQYVSVRQMEKFYANILDDIKAKKFQFDNGGKISNKQKNKLLKQSKDCIKNF